MHSHELKKQHKSLAAVASVKLSATTSFMARCDGTTASSTIAASAAGEQVDLADGFDNVNRVMVH